MRSTEYVLVGLRKHSTKRAHIIKSGRRERAWSFCDQLFSPLDGYADMINIDDVACGTCKDRYLREKMRLKPGWWRR